MQYHVMYNKLGDVSEILIIDDETGQGITVGIDEFHQFLDELYKFYLETREL